MENNQNDNLMTFGEHLEVFRKMLFRIIGITLCLAIVIFCAKDTTFQLLLAPGDNHFVTYQVIERLAACAGWNFRFEPYSIQLINTELASQFMTHVSTSVYLALLFVSPYIVIELYHYIAPALYENERRYSVSVAIAIYLLFMLGVLMSYFVLFPFALRFLGTYQVTASVVNQINLDSYISTFVTLTLLMGLVFQLPVVSFFLAKMGILEASFMKQYRRHAFVLIGIVAAVITPPDLFTCFMVMIPMYGLYELSIIIAKTICTNFQNEMCKNRHFFAVCLPVLEYHLKGF